MNIQQSTARYEAWLRHRVRVVESQLRDKHALMRSSPFVFLRGTFYRWSQLWPAVCPELRRAPMVLAVGDLHVDSFGTWRDTEGRLAFGVDDFDDAYPLPYTNDLVRLATSVKIVIDAELLTLSHREACQTIVESYAATLRARGRPIILAEEQEHLEKIGIDVLKPPRDFWKRVSRWPATRGVVPPGARRALVASLPTRRLPYTVVRREAGTGSLGQPRYVALAEWEGGRVAREAKAVVPPAGAWVDDTSGASGYYERAMRGAVRAPDPFQRVVGAWLVRRLSPDSNPIEIASLPKRRDEHVLLSAMAAEVANVHLGTPRQRRRVLADIRRRDAGWLRDASKTMAKVVEREWREYRRRTNR